VVVYRRFGTTYRSHIQGSHSLNCLTLEDKSAETSVTKYPPTPRDISEGQRPQIHDRGSLKSSSAYVFARPVIRMQGNVIKERYSHLFA